MKTNFFIADDNGRCCLFYDEALNKEIEADSEEDYFNKVLALVNYENFIKLLKFKHGENAIDA